MHWWLKQLEKHHTDRQWYINFEKNDKGSGASNAIKKDILVSNAQRCRRYLQQKRRSRKTESCVTKGQETHRGRWMMRGVDFTAWIRQVQNLHHSMEWLAKEEDPCLCTHTGATHSILKRDLVEPQSNLVINQHKQLLLQTATGESSTILGNVHMKFTLPTYVLEAKFPVVDICDKCIPGLDLMRKYRWWQSQSA